MQHVEPHNRPDVLLVWEHGPVAFERLVGLMPVKLPRHALPGIARAYRDEQIALGTPLLDQHRAMMCSPPCSHGFTTTILDWPRCSSRRSRRADLSRQSRRRSAEIAIAMSGGSPSDAARSCGPPRRPASRHCARCRQNASRSGVARIGVSQKWGPALIPAPRRRATSRARSNGSLLSNTMDGRVAAARRFWRMRVVRPSHAP